MLQLYNSSNISLIDELTIHSGVSSFELIDRASEAFTKWLLKRLEPNQLVQIICGPGNNGADGLAVALKLESWGYPVGVYYTSFKGHPTNENQYFQSHLRRSSDIKVTFICDENDIYKIDINAVIVDAILGNGINRKLEGKHALLVAYLNQHSHQIYSLDTPTGMLEHSKITELAIQAKETFSFQFPKLSFFAKEHKKYVGRWTYHPIGLRPNLLNQHPEKCFLIEQRDVSNQLQARDDFSHKGLMGRALIIMNNPNMLGAGLLSAKACLSMGAGYTYCLIDQKDDQGHAIYEPELIFKKGLAELSDVTVDALCVGPGLGQNKTVENTLLKILKANASKLILDADALNIIAKNNWHQLIPKGSIITPHLGEFKRLFGVYLSHFDRISAQRRYAQELGIYIILKGRYTSIADPQGNIYYNNTGNAALAKGGTGDVLSGILTSFTAQGYPSLEACILSVYLHGFAADIFLERFHEVNLTPLKLIEFLPIALKRII